MKLYDFKRAPNPRRVRMFIAEKGLEVEIVPVNLYRMEQLSPEFRAINPAGTVPVLETDDGERLAESVAICRYLESLQPEPPLFGTDELMQARVLMWNSIVEHEGMVAVAEVLRNLSPGFRDHVLPGPVSYAQLPELVQRGAQRTLQFCERIEQRLAESTYLAGDEFTFADMSLLVTVDFAKWVDIDATAGRPGLTDWYRRVASRPSAAA